MFEITFATFKRRPPPENKGPPDYAVRVFKILVDSTSHFVPASSSATRRRPKRERNRKRQNSQGEGEDGRVNVEQGDDGDEGEEEEDEEDEEDRDIWIYNGKSLVKKGIHVEQGWRNGLSKKELEFCIRGVMECIRENGITIVVKRGDDLKALLGFVGNLGIAEVFDLGVCRRVEREEREGDEGGGLGNGVVVGGEDGSQMEVQRGGNTVEVGEGIISDVNGDAPNTVPNDENIGEIESKSNNDNEKSATKERTLKHANAENRNEDTEDPATVVDTIEGLLQENGEAPGSSIRGAMLYSSRDYQRQHHAHGLRRRNSQVDLSGTAVGAWRIGAAFAALVDRNGWSRLRRSCRNKIQVQQSQDADIVTVVPGENPWLVVPTAVFEKICTQYYMSGNELKIRRNFGFFLVDAIKDALEWYSFVIGTDSMGRCRHSPIEVVCCVAKSNKHLREDSWVQQLLLKLHTLDSNPDINSMRIDQIVYQAKSRCIVCSSGGTRAKITLNSADRLSMNVLMAKASYFLGKSQLLCKGLLLIESWAHAFVTDQRNDRSFLTREMLELMVLYLANAFHTGFGKPFDILACFLTFYSSLDLCKYGLTLLGPVRLRNAKLVSPLLPKELLLPSSDIRYNEEELNKDVHQCHAMFIWSPVTCENVARHVTREEKEALTKALSHGCKVIQRIENDLVGDLEEEIRKLLGDAGRKLDLTGLERGNPAVNILLDRGAVPVSSSPDSNTEAEEVLLYKVWDATAQLIINAKVTKLGLLAFLVSVVERRESLLIGEIGQSLRNTHPTVPWSAILKDRFGGLKKLLRSAQGILSVGTEHPLNPRVRVCEGALRALMQMAASL